MDRKIKRKRPSIRRQWKMLRDLKSHYADKIIEGGPSDEETPLFLRFYLMLWEALVKPFVLFVKLLVILVFLAYLLKCLVV
ncbi:MAG: hypothetical protein ACRCUS_01260 [Anaerovoracaceae bacterium]